MILLTSNRGKLAIAQHVFAEHGIEVTSSDLRIPEPQAQTSQEIATAMATQAFTLLKQPVIREDHSFTIPELGMPGPFMAYIEKTMPVEKLAQIVSTLKSTSAYFELAATYCDSEGIHEFSYRVPVELEAVPRNPQPGTWDSIIRLPSETRCFSEYAEEERDPIWGENYKKIAELITSQQKTTS
jgi:non-canonical purine NTP pyrophosphatase (RdgB/HAM1 family)